MKSKQPKVLYTNNEEFGRVMKSPSTAFVVSLLAKDGVKYIHIHEWFKKKTGEWVPSRKGLSVPVNLPKFPNAPDLSTHPAEDFLELYTKAVEYGKSGFEIDNPDNYIIQQKKKED